MTDGVCDGVCDGVWLFGKDSFEECPLTLLAIFDTFKIWRHYLEGSTFPVDVVTDHKNLKYFSTTKILSRHQAYWLEFLSGFNMVIRFCPGRLGTKPNTLTHHPDLC